MQEYRMFACGSSLHHLVALIDIRAHRERKKENMSTDAKERLLSDPESSLHLSASRATAGVITSDSSTAGARATASQQGTAVQAAQNARAKWISTIITSTANFSVQ